MSMTMRQAMMQALRTSGVGKLEKMWGNFKKEEIEKRKIRSRKEV